MFICRLKKNLHNGAWYSVPGTSSGLVVNCREKNVNVGNEFCGFGSTRIPIMGKHLDSDPGSKNRRKLKICHNIHKI